MILKNPFLILIILSILSVLKPCNISASSDNQIEELLKNAILSSKRVEKIHEDGLKRRKIEFEQLDKILTYIKEHPEKDKDLKNLVLTKLEQDQKDFENFKPSGENATCQLIFNKMLIGIQGALKLLETSFYCICNEKLPEGYLIEPPEANIFPNEEHIYSSGRGISLKHLLIRTALCLQKSDDLKSLNSIIGCDVSTSPFIHFTPLSKNIRLSEYAHSPYFREDKVAIIHNGYAYGAQRSEGRIEPYGPNDCSSFISLYYGLPYMTTTSEQYLAWSINQGFHFESLGGEVVRKWNMETKPKFSDDKIVQQILNTTTPVRITDPSELESGWVSVEKKFPNFSDNPFILQNGGAGHTSGVLGTIGQDKEIKLWTLGANRDIESLNMDFSFGIQSRALSGDPFLISQKTVDPKTPLVMYFKSKEEN